MNGVMNEDRKDDHPLCAMYREPLFKCFICPTEQQVCGYIPVLHALKFYYHIVGRRSIGMARMPASRNTFSKPPNSQTKKI